MNVKYKPIAPQQKLYKSIVNQIQRMIRSGELNKGDRLPSERQLAEQFGVSRTAVREAIKSLAEIGLVDIMVGRGTFVANNTRDRIVASVHLLLDVEKVDKEDLQTARAILETPIARLAAKNRTEENCKKMQKLLDQMIVSKNRPKKFVDADTEFHIELAKASGNTAFVVLIQAIIRILRNERTYVRDFKEELDSAITYHREILYSVIQKDEEGAEVAMCSHLKHVAHVLKSLQEEL
jgi:GntR family transcriptional repressor for pyruvate dehydrogenase complex|tara:strand:- start:6814 stop:7524 length:711 start_codon:yes stop_codon:yes gene_type:complete